VHDAIARIRCWDDSRYDRSWTPLLVIAGLLHMLTYGTPAVWAQEGSSRQRIEAAWDKIEAAQAGAPASVQPSAASPLLQEYLTVGFGADYALNGANFSGDPTTTFVVDDGPDFTLTPNGVSFPQVFESTDHKFGSYLAVGTRGWGHERVNVYLSARLRSDLDGTTAGSPFQSILDDHDGTQFDLSNAFIEMRGLGVGRFSSRMSARVGRQFLPYFRIGMFGSSVMDGGKVAYVDERTDAEVFIGRWAPFYESVDGAVVGGGRILYELYPDPGSPVGLAPYAEYLYFNDGEGQSAYRHTYGIRGRWKLLDADGYVSVIDADPIELGVRANYVARRWTIYGRVRKRVSSDEFTYDIFLTAEELENSRRLTLGSLEPATELTVDADYNVRSWLTVGAGIWIYALDDDSDQTGFENSFQEVTGRVSVEPPGPWGGLLQYRYRHIDRGSTDDEGQFDDTSRTGETDYHELNAEISYRWRQFLQLRVGGYYGVYDTQGRLEDVDGIVITGGYLRARARVAKHVNFRFLFVLDKGNEEFHPDIDFQYTVRAGVDIYY